MSRPFIIVALFMAFLQAGFSQGSRTQELYGKKGLAITEQILSELNLPEWLWVMRLTMKPWKRTTV